MRVLRQVGANQHWPYGLVDVEGSEFYARQLDGNFFADVKNGSLFLQAWKEDAREKQVDADDHLNSIDRKATQFMKGEPNEPRKIVDRESFIDSLMDAISRDGKLTLVLGGKSVGKSLVVSYVAEQVRQAPHGNRTILLADMRDMPAKDFYEAVLSVASRQTNVLDILTQLPLFGKRFRAGPQSRAALAQITGITKQNLKASVVLISSEHGYPFKLAKAGLNLVDIQNMIIAPEVPPVDMFKMLTDHWGMGHRLARLFVATYGGIIPKMAKRPGLWPEVFHETKKEYVLVASTHHVRLKICKGYIQNNGGNLARVSLNWFQSLLQMFR
eukprot:s4130_g5.t1